MKQYDMKYTIKVPDNFEEIEFNKELTSYVHYRYGGTTNGYLEEPPKTKWEAIKNLLADLWLVICWGI